MGVVFAVLARLRFLRGTVLDPFGHTRERRTDRASEREYESALDSVLARLASGDRALALHIARFPEEIRGFGHVRAASIARLRPQLESVLEAQRHRNYSRRHAFRLLEVGNCR